jgi:glycosyltransferase involved in cell wall biosynthesis
VKVMVTAPWARKFGGGETMLMSFLRRVDKARFSLTVVFFEHGPFVAETRSLGLSTVVLPAGRLRQLRTAARVVRTLARVLDRERPDLLLNWMPKTHLYGAPARALAGSPTRVVWWQHGMETGHWLNKVATMLPAKAVGCSSARAAELQADQWPSRHVFVVHPGIDEPRQPSEREKLALRRRWEIPLDRPVLGLVGRLERGKRHDRFLDALRLVRDRGIDAHGLLVGGAVPASSPHAAADLDREIAQRSLTDAVTVTGQVDDARPLIASMDLLLSVASSESFGLAVVEAMALGVPVIADAVRDVLTRPQLRRRLRTGGKARFRSQFTTERMTRDLEQALTAVYEA